MLARTRHAIHTRRPGLVRPDGSNAGLVPLGVATLLQQPRAANCGWTHTSCISFRRALAICAASSRCTTCAAFRAANACRISAGSSSRLAVRRELDEKRSSVASAGWSKTVLQTATPSNSRCPLWARSSTNASSSPTAWPQAGSPAKARPTAPLRARLPRSPTNSWRGRHDCEATTTQQARRHRRVPPGNPRAEAWIPRATQMPCRKATSLHRSTDARHYARYAGAQMACSA